MNDHIKKAVVAVVDFGFCQVEGLMMPNGSYGIAISQANTILGFSTRQDHAVRSLKALLGKEIELTTVKTELSNNKNSVLTIEQFTELIFELATKRNNEIAIAFLKASMLETIERRFDAAFNKKVEEDERNARLELRAKSKSIPRMDYFG
jgi:hypothetical protein